MNKNTENAILNFKNSASNEVMHFISNINTADYEAAVSLITESKSLGRRLHITGIGKPGHVAEYMASLFSSTGTPCYFLHGTEAVHGSCGQLVSGDIVICISNSGETSEMKSTVLAIKNNGCKIIGVSGNSDSWLAKQSDVFICAGVEAEGGPLDRAPRNSILAEILALQTLSVGLQAECNQTPEQYVRCHPGGKLGELKEDEKYEI